MADVMGTLANGNRFRLSPSAIDIISPSGDVIHHLERDDISMYARFGNSLRIATTRGFSVELPAASDVDAHQLEEHIRRVRSGFAPIVAKSAAGSSDPANVPTSRFALLPALGMVFGVLLLTAVGAGAWFAYSTLLGHEDRATASYAPANSLGYIAVNTDPTSQAWLDAWQLARRAGIDDELARLPQEGLAESGEDAALWENLIKPAVGREVGLAVWTGEATILEEPNVAAIVMVADEEKARAVIDEILDAETPEAVAYRDVTYQIDLDDTAVGIVDDALIVTPSRAAFEDVVDAHLDGALDEVEAFNMSAGTAADDPLVFAYINTPGIIAAAEASGALNMLAMTGMTGTIDTYRDVGAVTMTVKADSDGLRFVTLTEGRPANFPLSPAGTAFTDDVPDSTVFFVAGFDLYETMLKPMMEQFQQLQDMEAPGQPGMPLDLQTALGLKYGESLAMHFRGPFAVSLNAEESSADLMGYAGAFHFFSEVDDPVAMQDALNALASGLESEGLPVMRTDSGFSIVTPEGITADISVIDNVLEITGNYGTVTESGTLANDLSYRLAMDGMPANASMTGYIALDKIIDLVPDVAWAEADPEVRTALEALGPMAYAVAAEGNGTRTEAVLFVVEP